MFASVMATLGLQIILESGRQLVSKVCEFSSRIGIQASMALISRFLDAECS